MSSIYTIYSAFCVVTKQRYIGFDSKWPHRKSCHKREYKKQKYSIKFYNAIQKYGWENFVWEILYQAKEILKPQKSHTLNVMEKYFIEEYDTINNGYNICSGGQCGPVLYGNNNGMFGKTHSENVKKKLSIEASIRLKNKSYEELYGIEKSKVLKQIRSKQMKGVNHKYKNNGRFDHKEYSFFNIKTGELLICNRWTFCNVTGVSRPSASEIINSCVIRNNWTILYT